MPATRTSSTTRTPKQKQRLQITLPSRRSVRKSSPIPAAGSKVSKPSNSSGGKYFTIRSSNDVKISVRSEVLQSYLPQLYEDHKANPETEIKLPYSSHALLLMVGFLSRGSFQSTTKTSPFDYLSDCFHAAKAYGLSPLTTWLRSELSHPRSVYYMGDSPIHAYSICSVYNFKVEKELAFQHCIGTIDFSDSTSIASVSSKCQDPTVTLELISRLSRRNAVILDLFGTLHAYPLDLRSYLWWDERDIDTANHSDFTCSSCRDDIIFKVPSWMIFWAHFAKMELLNKPGVECEHVFNVGFMTKRRDGSDFFGDNALEEEDREFETPVCRGCLKKILIESPDLWEDWAQDIKRSLREKLGSDF